MATITSNRRTQLPVDESSLVRPVSRSNAISEEAIARKKEELRLETMAKFDIEAEARTMRRERKLAEQAARDRESKKVDAAAHERKVAEWQRMIDAMSDKEFRKFQERIDYMPVELEDMIKTRSGLPTVAKAIRHTTTAELEKELERRRSGITSASPVTADSSLSLEAMAEENAAS